MAHNKKEPGRFHEVIQTKYVFIEDEQVFMKRETQEYPSDRHGEVWYPIQLEWIPV